MYQFKQPLIPQIIADIKEKIRLSIIFSFHSSLTHNVAKLMNIISDLCAYQDVR